jgi:hypothetical protein
MLPQSGVDFEASGSTAVYIEGISISEHGVTKLRNSNVIPPLSGVDFETSGSIAVYLEGISIF